MSTIAILLPVRNGERYLRECVDSVLRQTFTDFEMIVGDDGSTDRSREILAAIDDPRVRVVTRKQNIGLFPNLNELAHRARAPVLRFLCQDDVLEPDTLETELRFLDENPDVGMCYCKARVVDSAGVARAEWELGDLPETVEPRTALQLLYYFGCLPGNLSTVCLRREALPEDGPFDVTLRLAADYDLWVRICRRHPLGVVQRRLVRLRSHEAQLSRVRGSGAVFVGENRRVRESIRPLLPESARRSAAGYEWLRHDVLDAHYCLRSIAGLRWADARTAARSMGSRRFSKALVAWALTANNRLFRPKAPVA